MSWRWLDERPIVVVIAGSNGAGKTTFFHSQIAHSGLRFVNADQLAKEIETDPYTAAKLADRIRRELVNAGESFAFETVFSDPVGEKVEFLKDTALKGYSIVVCFIGIENSSISEERVAMRVTQGGHDVPTDKLKARFPRTLRNLKLAMAELPHVLIFDNSDLSNPFRLIAECTNGKLRKFSKQMPKWLMKTLH